MRPTADWQLPGDRDTIAALAGRPVVKAFNAILADIFANGGKPRGAIGRIAIPSAYCTALSSDELHKAIIAADKAAGPRNRDGLRAKIEKDGIRPGTEELVQLCREFYNRL